MINLKVNILRPKKIATDVYVVIKINTFTSDKALINKTTTQFIVSNFLSK